MKGKLKPYIFLCIGSVEQNDQLNHTHNFTFLHSFSATKPRVIGNVFEENFKTVFNQNWTQNHTVEWIKACITNQHDLEITNPNSNNISKRKQRKSHTIQQRTQRSPSSPIDPEKKWKTEEIWNPYSDLWSKPYELVAVEELWLRLSPSAEKILYCLEKIMDSDSNWTRSARTLTVERESRGLILTRNACHKGTEAEVRVGWDASTSCPWFGWESGSGEKYSIFSRSVVAVRSSRRWTINLRTSSSQRK